MKNPLKGRVVLASSIALLLMTGLCQCAGLGEYNPKTKVIAIIVPSQENPFFKAEADAAKAKAEALGYTTVVLDHRDDPAIQEKHLDTAIALNAAAIILDNAGTNASTSQIKKVKDKGIPSFLIEREINRNGIAVCQIIPNNYQGATLAGEEFVRLMKGTGNYIELLGRDSDASVHIRSKGFHDVIDNYPEMKIAARETVNWSQSEAYQKIKVLITMLQDIKGVICENDTMALGAMTALKEAGRGDVIVTGFDASNEVIDSIKAGEIKATILQPITRIAEMAVTQADTYLRTGSTGKPEKQLFNCELITADNADKYWNFRPVK